MSEEPREKSKTDLGLAIGQGVSVTAWGRSAGVPPRTAYRWAKDPLVRKTVEAYRRRTIDRAIGRMTKHTPIAADGIVAIAKSAELDSVRLRACRAVFSDMTTTSRYFALETRMHNIEQRLAGRAAAKARRSPANAVPIATPSTTPAVTASATGAG